MRSTWPYTASGAHIYHLDPGQSLADGLRDVAKDQIDRALTDLDAADIGPHESVHEARKRCKKVRALLRLVRDAVPDTYDQVNTELRDIARLVSDERDAAAFVEAHQALVEDLGDEALGPFGEVAQQLVAHRDGDVLERVGQRLLEVRRRLATARWRIDSWELPEGDGVAALRAGYRRTYGRARDRWQEAIESPSSHVWHQWRKRAKYNRHHVNLLQEAWPDVLDLREDLLHDLTDHLGDDHDLAELRRTLVDDHLLDLDEQVLTGYVALLDGRRTRLQHLVPPLAARCHGQPVDEHCDMVFAWWRRAVDEAGATALDQDGLTPIVPHGT